MTDQTTDAPLPALYLGHGAPPLLDDAQWMSELAGWSANLPRPTSILIVSAHWQTAPMAIGATTTVPLVYDFYGFPQRYYEYEYRRFLGDADPAGRVLAVDDHQVRHALGAQFGHRRRQSLTARLADDIPYEEEPHQAGERRRRVT